MIYPYIFVRSNDMAVEVTKARSVTNLVQDDALRGLAHRPRAPDDHYEKTHISSIANERKKKRGTHHLPSRSHPCGQTTRE